MWANQAMQALAHLVEPGAWGCAGLALGLQPNRLANQRSGRQGCAQLMRHDADGGQGMGQVLLPQIGRRHPQQDGATPAEGCNGRFQPNVT